MSGHWEKGAWVSGKPKEKLFVYGIFLGESARINYGMSDPRYDTVLDYATFGGGIVQAEYAPGVGLSLTGLVVDIDPYQWDRLDRLETGYDRVKVKTTGKVDCWMYAQKGSK